MTESDISKFVWAIPSAIPLNRAASKIKPTSNYLLCDCCKICNDDDNFGYGSNYIIELKNGKRIRIVTEKLCFHFLDLAEAKISTRKGKRGNEIIFEIDGNKYIFCLQEKSKCLKRVRDSDFPIYCITCDDCDTCDDLNYFTHLITLFPV